MAISSPLMAPLARFVMLYPPPQKHRHQYTAQDNEPTRSIHYERRRNTVVEPTKSDITSGQTMTCTTVKGRTQTCMRENVRDVPFVGLRHWKKPRETRPSLCLPPSSQQQPPPPPLIVTPPHVPPAPRARDALFPPRHGVSTQRRRRAPPFETAMFGLRAGGRREERRRPGATRVVSVQLA